jgi:plasmid stability protein
VCGPLSDTICPQKTLRRRFFASLVALLLLALTVSAARAFQDPPEYGPPKGTLVIEDAEDRAARQRTEGVAGTYGMMYGMQKTTVYLPAELKQALAELAARRGQSEADIVREALAALTAAEGPPPPRLPLFRSGKPSLAERVDVHLKGFGRR